MSSKDVIWMGDSLDVLRKFPIAVRTKLGEDIRRLQLGVRPVDGRPMKTVGRGVRELRAAGSGDQYRAIYVIRKADGIYILHAFVKKSRTTARHDIETAKRRLKDI